MPSESYVRYGNANSCPSNEMFSYFMSTLSLAKEAVPYTMVPSGMLVPLREKSRVKYLVENGSNFSEAKEQAKREILGFFSIHSGTTFNSEFLDILGTGDENAMLLAISLLLQGYRDVVELSDLLTNINSDIMEDGALNDARIGSSLINHAKYLNVQSISTNIQKLYDELEISTNIPDFEKYIQQFIDSTGYEYTNLITYPENGAYGLNILSEGAVGDISLDDGDLYSMTAVVPDPIHITVTIQFHINDTWAIDPLNSGWESMWLGSNTFKFWDDNFSNTLDLSINLRNTGSATIKIFENNSLEPSSTNEINWSNIP